MNKIFSDLRGIGIFFTAKPTDFKKEIVSPECAIMSALSIVKSDLLTLELLYTWLKYNSELIHAESLQKKVELETNHNSFGFFSGPSGLYRRSPIIEGCLKNKVFEKECE